MSGARSAEGFLDGVRVVDLSRVLAGPYTASLLAELGADVVKVEAPAGDPARSIGPFVGGRSLYFSSVNSGKRGIVLDLQEHEQRDHLAALLDTADIMIENFLPNVGRRLQLTPSELLRRHPHLVVVSLSGFARGSDAENQPVFDLVVQAESGIMSVTGERGRPPARVGVPIGDLAAGLWGGIAALAGYSARLRGGRGRHVEVPLFDASLSMLSYMATAALHERTDPPPIGSGHHSVVPYGAYPTTDGWIVIAVIGDRFFPLLVDVLGLSELDDGELLSNASRVAARRRIDEAIAIATAQYSTAKLTSLLRDAGIPSAPVRGLFAALSAPYVRDRGLVEAFETEQPYQVVRGPIRTATDRLRPAPALGEHTTEVLRELGRLPPTRPPPL